MYALLFLFYTDAWGKCVCVSVCACVSNLEFALHLNWGVFYIYVVRLLPMSNTIQFGDCVHFMSPQLLLLKISILRRNIHAYIHAYMMYVCLSLSVRVNEAKCWRISRSHIKDAVCVMTFCIN